MVQLDRSDHDSSHCRWVQRTCENFELWSVPGSAGTGDGRGCCPTNPAIWQSVIDSAGVACIVPLDNSGVSFNKMAMGQ